MWIDGIIYGYLIYLSCTICEPTVILSFCCRVLKGCVFFRGGGSWENPKDSGRKDWGNLREHQGRLGESPPPPLRILLPSLKLTEHLIMHGWNTSFLWGWPIFRGYVKLWGCILLGVPGTPLEHLARSSDPLGGSKSFGKVSLRCWCAFTTLWISSRVSWRSFKQRWWWAKNMLV